MNQNQLVRKADLALSDLQTGGGLLQPSASNRFIRKVIDTPRMMRDARFVPMRGPQMDIHKIGFGERVLRAARNSSTQRSGPYPIGQRALAVQRTQRIVRTVLVKVGERVDLVFAVDR